MQRGARLLGTLAGGLLILLVAAQLVRPDRTNPPTDPQRAIHARVEVPARIDGILAAACGDCHSHATRWPWYAKVAPVSWYVIDHVNHGRSHLNFSDWPADPGESGELLKAICAETKAGRMPLAAYVRMHPDARLSPAEIAALCSWAEAAAARADARQRGTGKPGGDVKSPLQLPCFQPALCSGGFMPPVFPHRR